MHVTREELERSWTIAAQDTRERVFACHPFELIFCERRREHVLELCSQPGYHPGELIVVDQPKGRGLLRPGGSLGFADHLVYTALVARTLPKLRDRLARLGKQCDYAYVLKAETVGGRWFDSWFHYYKKFTSDSLERLGRYKFVSVLDIAGYYELIDHRRLLSELDESGVDGVTRSDLAKLLGRWSRISHRGIPQGFSASDVLGKWYLVPCDEMLANRGHDHIRWVDDYRFFGDSEEEVTVAAQDAARTLRRFGLVLQSAKFRVMTANVARAEFERVQAVIEPIRRKWQESAISSLSGSDLGPSVPDFVLEAALESQDSEKVDDESREILIEAYNQQCLGKPGSDKTVLRYLLNKMGKLRVADFVVDVLAKLAQRPEETRCLLNYLACFDVDDHQQSSIIMAMRSGRSTASYQSYEILRWFVRSKITPSADMIVEARELLADANMPEYVRGAARLLLGLHGNAGDLEEIHGSYAQAGSDLAKATIICCLEKREKAIRNQFLKYAREDGVLCGLASESVEGAGMLRQAWSFLSSK